MFKWLFGRNKRVEAPCSKKIEEAKAKHIRQREENRSYYKNVRFDNMKREVLEKIPDEIKDCIQMVPDEDGGPIIIVENHKRIYTLRNASGKLLFSIGGWSFEDNFIEALMKAQK